jgi:hypothetical protein
MILKDILGATLIARVKKDNKSVSHKKKQEICVDIFLFMKWAYKIPKGWYGFALGDTVPYSWYAAIDKVLVYIESLDPKFKIHQIKLKFGGLRFYIQLSNKNKERHINRVIDSLEKLLHDDKLKF